MPFALGAGTTGTAVGDSVRVYLGVVSLGVGVVSLGAGGVYLGVVSLGDGGVYLGVVSLGAGGVYLEVVSLGAGGVYLGVASLGAGGYLGVVSLGDVTTGLSKSIGFGEGLLGDALAGGSGFMLAGGHLLVTGALVLGAGSGGASRFDGDALVGGVALGTLGDRGGTLDGSGGGRDIVDFLYCLAN